ncbi:TetR/AcrR family transcriptional regulator [Erythrobacter rubeus]|uniref:TetR/AcrR family transcriptional regulator n=1 Tax=Erythrobacter rubeus TaxID=2760803 RepID=A0ABR8KXI1_9SPHN|nr:TetR/AcrR family transcriptional regulator [Erythrobacter rubeus]MBD2842921.1 TetR/AcrR family transcriptional regulator [Erythrobacter rubeus]
MNIAAFPTKGERTRAHIVASASALFWRHSFHGVSVDLVAEAAEVNKATVYRYFADKRDLALAVIRYNGEMTLAEVFVANFETFDAPQDRLAAIYRMVYCAHVGMQQESGDVHGCPIVGLALELGQDMPEIREEAQRIFDQVETYLCDIAETAAAILGREVNAISQGRTLTQLLHGAFASARVASDPSRILDAGRASLALIGFPDKPILNKEQPSS